MALTRLEFVNYIKRDGFRRDDKDAEIIEYLDDTLYELSTIYEFNTIETSSDINLVADTYSYSFPSTFSMFIDGVRYLDAQGDGYLLNKLDKIEFERKYPDLTASEFHKDEPNDFTIYGNNIWIAPFPETVTTELITVFGAEVATPLSTDSSTTQFQDRFREVIKRGVLYRLWNMLDEPDKSDRQLTLYQQGVRKMVEIDEKKSEGPTQIYYRGV